MGSRWAEYGQLVGRIWAIGGQNMGNPDHDDNAAGYSRMEIINFINDAKTRVDHISKLEV